MKRTPLAIAGLLLAAPLAHAQNVRRAPDRASLTPEMRRLYDAKMAVTAILIYLGDHGDRFPAAKSTADLTKTLALYLRGQTPLSPSPQGGKIVYNVALAGFDSMKIPLPASTPILWEERAWADGKRAVAYADGHAKRLSAAEWAKLWSGEIARRKALRGKKG